MLQHIALTVNDSEEIENFYEDVLLFTLKHKFTVNDKLSETVFNVREETDVYVMRSHGQSKTPILYGTIAEICLKSKKLQNNYNTTL
jgi:catechol 2,3-dioxygenase-like lactoylglutathione lyase family enzyme